MLLHLLSTLGQGAKEILSLIHSVLAAQILELETGSHERLITPGSNLVEEDLDHVKAAFFNKGVEEDVICKGIEVKALEAHFTKKLEGNINATSHSIAHDQSVIEADTIQVVIHRRRVGGRGGSAATGPTVCSGAANASGGELVEPIEEDRHELGTGEDLKDCMVCGTRVVEARLPSSPIEEDKAG